MRLIQDERRQSRLEAHTRIVYKLGTDPCVLYPIYSLPPICSILDDWMGSRGGGSGYDLHGPAHDSGLRWRGVGDGRVWNAVLMFMRGLGDRN